MPTDYALKKPEIYIKNQPKNLEEISIKDLKNESPNLDKGIKNLVRALRSLGLRTIGSCEGHLNKEHQYPWVTCENLKYYKEMYELIYDYNKKRKIKWMINKQFSALEPFTPPAQNEGELKDLQKSSENLAQFLFQKFYN
jgi:hypothetical protein